MEYAFDIDVAVQYGVYEAIFLKNLCFWISHNQANDTNYFEVDAVKYPELSGEKRHFTYNSNKAYTELFPFWSEKQMRNVIESLEREKVIITGNYNETKYDRTKWYAFYENPSSQKGKCICPKGQMELPKRANGTAQKGEPIPDSKPDSKPDEKPNTASPVDFVPEIEISEKVWEYLNCNFSGETKERWKLLCNEPKWKKKTEHALDICLKNLMSFEENFSKGLIETAIANNYQGVVFPSTKKEYQKWLEERPSLAKRRKMVMRDDYITESDFQEAVRKNRELQTN